MTDFTTQIFRWCQANEFWEIPITGSGGNLYTVEYHNRRGWSCTCSGYKYRKWCKHIEAAEQQKCDHGWEAACGSPSNDWTKDSTGNICCPKCDGPTSLVEVTI